MKTEKLQNNSLYSDLIFMRIKEGEIPTFPFYSEIKYNGEFQYLIKRNGALFLASREKHKRIRFDAPLTKSISNMPDNSVFIGELISHYGKDYTLFNKCRFSDVLRFAVFGVLKYNGQDINLPYLEMRELLNKQKFYNDYVFLTRNTLINDKEELNNVIRTIKDEGFEGLILKPPLSRYIQGASKEYVKIKFEPNNDCNLVVMGFKVDKDFYLRLGHKINGRIIPLTLCNKGLTLQQKQILLSIFEKHIRKGGISFGSSDFYESTKLIPWQIVVSINYESVIKNSNDIVVGLFNPVFKGFRLDLDVDEVDTII